MSYEFSKTFSEQLLLSNTSDQLLLYFPALSMLQGKTSVTKVCGNVEKKYIIFHSMKK